MIGWTNNGFGYTPRVLIARPGLEGGDDGAREIAAALRNAGMEVVYSGLRTTVEQIAAAAVQESVDVIGLSIVSGEHVELCARLREELTRLGAQDLPVVLGGEVGAGDGPALAALGVRRIYGAETPLYEVVAFIEWLCEPKAFLTPGPAAAVQEGV